jgi:hypothetical protein
MMWPLIEAGFFCAIYGSHLSIDETHNFQKDNNLNLIFKN